MSKQISVRIDEGSITDINKLVETYKQEGLKVSFNSVLDQCLSEGIKTIKERRGMVLACPKCTRLAKYIKDEETEKLGGYAFDCDCGEKFSAPKNNPLIKIL